MQILTSVNTLLATFRTRGIMQAETLLQNIYIPLTRFRASVRRFLSTLHYTMLSTRGKPPGLELLHVFYGTLILLLIRATLKATFSCSTPGYSVSWHHVIPDTTFEIGTAYVACLRGLWTDFRRMLGRTSCRGTCTLHRRKALRATL